MGNASWTLWTQDQNPAPSILHSDGILLGGMNLGAAGADIDSWASGTHILSPNRNDGVPPPSPEQVQLPLSEALESGEHGSGYYTYGTDPSGRPGTAANGQWGQPRTMEVIGAVADRLAMGDAYTPFGVGNISLQAAGPFKGHAGHQDGLGLDVRPARADGAELPVSYQEKQYDRAATQRLIDAFRATGQVDKIYFNDSRIQGVQPWAGHDNHFHVQLKR
jgi:penicillin-insensitive murein DD-endopeptidase